MAVSVRDVAQAAGVSVGTVSNVLNHPDKVAPATVTRVLAVIDELGFVRNDAARQLRMGKSRSIGMLIPDVGNPFFAALVRGAQARAADVGLAVLVGASDGRVSREDTYLSLFREQRVHGVLVTPVTGDHAKLARLNDAGVPVILVDQESTDDRLSSVSVDDVEGGYLAVRHLLDTGRRRIAFLGGPVSVLQVSHRLMGASRAVGEVPDASLEIIETPELTVLSGRAAGERLVDRDASARPDAVFAANDLVAVGLVQALALLHDLRVPEDIAVVGYDDIDFAASSIVPLTSVRQPAEQIGASAVELLPEVRDGDAQEPVRIRYLPELIVRSSTVRGRIAGGDG
ncbi:LacI family DNA-binding transcriptional regulator [Microbacterium sp. zg.Y909]|uniref:LacI family DNA-binding transcriptional regulator n=1 Tax=Microbacterium sp. zg.Y909 TaxID=2969413 RepID=UPI00214C77C7|nr:LacI family DNA-binding transcriptional regulator [Microbacterium sp. zg.Y909]MCR2824367.1 LacI family transcriptional regulator [Microbacterium sp. zg.Y909]